MIPLGVCSQYTKSAFTSHGLQSFQRCFIWCELFWNKFTIYIFPKISWTHKIMIRHLLTKFTSSSIWSSPVSPKRKWTSQTVFLSDFMFNHVCFSLLAHKPRTLVLKFLLFSRQWEVVIRSLFRIICHLFTSDVRKFLFKCATLFHFLILKTRAKARATEAKI